MCVWVGECNLYCKALWVDWWHQKSALQIQSIQNYIFFSYEFMPACVSIQDVCGCEVTLHCECQKSDQDLCTHSRDLHTMLSRLRTRNSFCIVGCYCRHIVSSRMCMKNVCGFYQNHNMKYTNQNIRHNKRPHECLLQQELHHPSL